MKKSTYICISFVLSFTLLLSSISWASFSTIYSTKTSTLLAPGIEQMDFKKFTSDGWLSIHALKVDLKKKNNKIDTLINSKSLQKLKNIQDMSDSNNAVAAINSGFFNWGTKDTNPYPDGPIVKNGKVIAMDSQYNAYSNSMATFSLNKLNKADYSYWKPNIALVAATGQKMEIGQYNKPSANAYNDFSIYDKTWSGKSIGASDKYPDLIEVYVLGNKVKQIRYGKPSFKMGSKGYVIVTRTTNKSWIEQNIKLGDTIALNFDVGLDLKNMRMAATGSAILLQDGKIPAKFSYEITGRQPRTAIGTNKSRKTMYMVTVDGRQQGSVGMSQQELADFMQKELKCYQALNLDGGGSTTMVARQPGDENVSLVNSPSDGVQRNVLSGIGLFVPSSGELDSLILKTDEPKVFIDSARSFSVLGADKYLNNVSLDGQNITYSVSGVSGYVKNNTFYPKSAGKALITAQCGDASGQLTIDVLETPVKLDVTPSMIVSNIGKHTPISVIGADENGYSATIGTNQWSASLENNLGAINNGEFVATSNGKTNMTIKFGKVLSICPIFIGQEEKRIIESFENENATFSSVPTNVLGAYKTSSNTSHEGNSSGELSYSFEATEGTRAAYINFNNDGINIPETSTTLSVWAKSNSQSGGWLRAELTDKTGQKKLVDFSKTLDFTDWKELKVPLVGVSLPAKLRKIYVAQTKPVKEENIVWLDELSVVSGVLKNNINSMDQIQDKKLVSTSPSEEGVLRIGVVNTVESMETLQLKIFSSPSLFRIQKLNAVIYPAKSLLGLRDASSNLGWSLTESTYGAKDFGNVKIIYVDSSKGGIRTTNSAQWNTILSNIADSQATRIILSLSISPDQFEDKSEKQLLEDVLAKSGKEVWVVFPGIENRSYMKDGIKYLSANSQTKGISANGNLEPEGYYEMVLKGEDLTYDFVGL